MPQRRLPKPVQEPSEEEAALIRRPDADALVLQGGDRAAYIFHRQINTLVIDSKQYNCGNASASLGTLAMAPVGKFSWSKILRRWRQLWNRCSYFSMQRALLESLPSMS